MQKYSDVVIDFTGTPVPNATVLVKNYPAATTATIYGTNATTSATTNPLTTDSYGRFGFYAVNGRYSLQLSATLFNTQTIDDILFQDGNNPLTGQLDMNGYKIINLGAPSSLTDAMQNSFTQSGTGAVARTLQSKLRDIVSVTDFGAKADGVTDDTAAIQAAVNAVAVAGGTVFFPPGTYLLSGATGADSKKNGILIPYTTQAGLAKRVKLLGAGRSTVLKSGSTGMYVIRLSDSYCAIHDLSIDGNSLGSVSGLGLVPEDVTQTTTRVDQNFNDIRNIEIRNCVEGLEMKTGPQVGGADSGCWYNNFFDLNVYSCTRSIWLRDCVGTGSGVNRNNFFGGRCGQSPCNTGIQIDDGNTNHFYAVHFEGIETGTSPNTTPTAIKIANTGASGAGCESNSFYGSTFEVVTRHLDNNNSYSEFYGCHFDGTKVLLTLAPVIMIGGYNAANAPQIYPWGVYNANGLIGGYSNGMTFDIGGQKILHDGRIVAAGSFEEVSGSSGNIGVGATFDITVPNPRRGQLLMLYSTYNLGQGGLYFVHGDNSGTITVSILKDDGGASPAGQAANTVRVTNNYAGTANIYWSLTPLGLGV